MWCWDWAATGEAGSSMVATQTPFKGIVQVNLKAFFIEEVTLKYLSPAFNISTA
jgi:hypothetical protein